MINIRLQSLFPNSKLVLDSLLDSAVSHGASIIANEELSKKLSDISPMNIGFCNKFGEMDVIIHRNSKIPVSFKLIKVVYVDYENISIYQGINKLCQFN